MTGLCLARESTARFCTVSLRLRSAGFLSCGFAAIVLFLLVLPLSLQSQEAASLRGTVRNAQGNPVAGATVQLRAQDATPTQTAHTDLQGNYSFPALRGGVYVCRTEMAGYSDVEISAVFIGPNEAKTVDLVLQPANTPASSPTQKPEFFVEPQFTVAGVTDTTSLGGHGSDAIVRTRETLAKETVSLGKDPAGAASTSNYERERDDLQALLIHKENAHRENNDEPDLHHQLGDVQEKLGNSLEAVREYQRAAELNPSETYLFDWGSELLLHHAPEPALEVFTQGNHLFPRSVRMLIGLGSAWFARGSYDQAVQRICAASDLNPSDPIPYLFLGKMQSVQATISDDVIEKLHRFVALQPENADANYYYAVGLWKLRREPEDRASAAQIENLLRNAIRLDPKYGAAYLQLGILHSAQKDYPRAISDYQQAVQTDPRMKEAHYRLSQAYRQTGDVAKAAVEVQIYDQIAKESAQEAERERHEIRQFVYTLRDQPTPQAP
jgi:tetratricopeptide (TPR) repeat protein